MEVTLVLLRSFGNNIERFGELCRNRGRGRLVLGGNANRAGLGGSRGIIAVRVGGFGNAGHRDEQQ